MVLMLGTVPPMQFSCDGPLSASAAKWIYKAHPPWSVRLMYMKLGWWDYWWVTEYNQIKVGIPHECKHIEDLEKADTGFIYASLTLKLTMRLSFI